MENKIKILKFSAKWCSPCRRLQTYLPEVVAETGIAVHSYDADEHEKKFEEFGVRAVPTLIFFKNDLEVCRKTGLIGKDELIRLIREQQAKT